jgi:hypothetical protein
MQKPYDLTETEVDTSDAERRIADRKLSSMTSGMSLDVSLSRTTDYLRLTIFVLDVKVQLSEVSRKPRGVPQMSTATNRKRQLSSTQTPPVPKFKQRLMGPAETPASRSSLEPVPVKPIATVTDGYGVDLRVNAWS